MTTNVGGGSGGAYREQIVSTLAPLRPLANPSRRVWTLVPLGLLLAGGAPLLLGSRRDLNAYAPLITWGATAQATTPLASSQA